MKPETKKDLTAIKDINFENLDKICNYMFVARNIILDDTLMAECLKTLDRLYRSESGNN